LKEARHQGFVGRERDHAIADVAGRQHVKIAAQAAGAAAVVGDGHHCCELDPAFTGFDVAF
jgi:hypothetical protein